jgi:peptidoglycan/LPS O-acetylase OafA/YrhL
LICKGLGSRLLVGLGQVSYSLYLGHETIIWAVRYIALAIAPGLPQLTLLMLLTGVAVPVAIGIAVVTYNLIERPSMALGKLEVTRLWGWRLSPASRA